MQLGFVDYLMLFTTDRRTKLLFNKLTNILLNTDCKWAIERKFEQLRSFCIVYQDWD